MSKLLALFCLFFIGIHGDPPIKAVAKKFENGNPRVIVYYDADSRLKLKEEVFFENGSPDYTGNYKNRLEHGEWIYYWRNGNIKSFEYYVNGLEDGEMFDYDKNGNLIKTYVYSSGVLIETR